ncbi:MAG: hypothetical protein KGQ49_03210 [Verrucomicrobia bacterium]|nr:hypothetical protein [Verrucomicrobiota bacterium]MBU6446390.1 hypothetical protein [Verrucomicrobiota bacterium]MDE3046723.1 hypothetical protein [Verrucomicrobiota bacterium]
MKKIATLLALLPLLAWPQEDEVVSPQEIQEQLNDAETTYRQAKSMFNPWYTGPLVTPSASMMAPGSANIQPYLFVTGSWATYNSHRHTVDNKHNLYSVQLNPLLQVGITDTMDVILSTAGIVNWQDGHNGGGFNDLVITIGFPITRETLYVPRMKFTIAETFPTGKYQHLSTNGLGLNATGGGSYQTTFGFATGKVIWWTYPHPMNLRAFVGYTIPTDVHVKDFNTYGGGFDTNGTVRPGNKLSADFGMEFSFTQRWVFAMDVVYVATNMTHFHGNPGHTADGGVAIVGNGYSDNLSLAPAFEYNWNDNLGIVTGVQFSVYGRNSNVFATGQFSVTYTW